MSGVAGGSIEGRTSFCDNLVADLVFADAFEGAFALPLAPFGLGMAVGVFKVCW